MGFFDAFVQRQRVSTQIAFDVPRRSVRIVSSYDPSDVADLIFVEFLSYITLMMGANPVVIGWVLEDLFAMAPEKFARPDAHREVRQSMVDRVLVYTKIKSPTLSATELGLHRSRLEQSLLFDYEDGGYPSVGSVVQTMDLELKLTKARPLVSISRMDLDVELLAASTAAFVEHSVRAIHHFVDANPRAAELRDLLIGNFQDFGKQYLVFENEASKRPLDPFLALGQFMKMNRIYFHD
jgi:hypothetical protein